MPLVIEVASFRLREGVDEAAFLDADAAVQVEAAPFCPGFVRRTMTRGDDGGWAVHTMWGSTEMADEAAVQIAEHPAGRRLASLIDESTLERRRYSTLD